MTDRTTALLAVGLLVVGLPVVGATANPGDPAGACGCVRQVAVSGADAGSSARVSVDLGPGSAETVVDSDAGGDSGRRIEQSAEQSVEQSASQSVDGATGSVEQSASQRVEQSVESATGSVEQSVEQSASQRASAGDGTTATDDASAGARVVVEEDDGTTVVRTGDATVVRAENGSTARVRVETFCLRLPGIACVGCPLAPLVDCDRPSG